MRDFRSCPFERMVVMGDSITAGASATAESRRWANVAAELVGRFQGRPVTLVNMGVGANVISPRSPGYESSSKPSALERYREDVIAQRPDLLVLAYGLNDMRAGMPPEDYRQDLARIVSDVQAACHPVIVLNTVYHMSAYDWYAPFDRGSVAATQVYNLVIRQLAEQYGCILADVWSAMGQADWTVHPDTVHPNDLGHALIGHRVFEAVATRCSGVATRASVDTEADRRAVLATLDQRRPPKQAEGQP